MHIMRLGDFIIRHMEDIQREWEAFAATIVPPALSMDSKALRNHSKLMLQAIALDLTTPQTDEQQFEKSHGVGRLLSQESSAETHAAGRMLAGFTIEQLFSEYRALRASVLKLWAANGEEGMPTDLQDVVRFNEAVDQAVAESVARYSEMVTKSQHLFLAILAHDLRNPLSTTLMAARFIQGGSDVPGKYVTAATRIQSAAQRMNTLVSDLIDFTKTNLGVNLPIVLAEADLAVLCRDAVAEQEVAHPEAHIEVLYEGDLKGRWDPNRISQVLSNLLGNAVQHGDLAETIVLRVKAQGDDIVLEVQSKGKLIPPENYHTVFEPLVRLAGGNEPAKAQGTSLGIGLYISREIVHAHGGMISVTSIEGAGTTFRIVMPRSPSVDVRHAGWSLPVAA